MDGFRNAFQLSHAPATSYVTLNAPFRFPTLTCGDALPHERVVDLGVLERQANSSTTTIKGARCGRRTRPSRSTRQRHA